MENIAGIPAQACAMPRFEDGAINLQELIRRLAEDVANGIMDAEADQMCEATGNSRNGYRPRTLKTCVGELCRGSSSYSFPVRPCGRPPGCRQT